MLSSLSSGLLHWVSGTLVLWFPGISQWVSMSQLDSISAYKSGIVPCKLWRFNFATHGLAKISCVDQFKTCDTQYMLLQLSFAYPRFHSFDSSKLLLGPWVRPTSIQNRYGGLLVSVKSPDLVNSQHGVRHFVHATCEAWESRCQASGSLLRHLQRTVIREA